MSVDLLVLAKSPRPGRVKTRCCPPCTPEEAAELACAAITDTLLTAHATPGVRVTLVLDGPRWSGLPARTRVVPQSNGELGDRLGAAFHATVGPTVLIGMDTPQITALGLRAVVDTLARPDTDAVLGPTADGGWWVLGARDPSLPLFAGVPMSTATTGERQRARLHTLGLGVRSAPLLTDVDTFADALSVAATIPDSEFGRAVARIERAHATRVAA